MEFTRTDKHRLEAARSGFLTLPTLASPVADLQTRNCPWISDLNSSSKFSETIPVSPSTSNDSGYGYQESPTRHRRSTSFFPLTRDEDQFDFDKLDDEVFLSETCEEHGNYEEHEGSVVHRNRTPNCTLWSTEIRSGVSSTDICNALSRNVSRHSGQSNISCKFVKEQMKLGDEALSDDVDADKVDKVLPESSGPRRIQGLKHRAGELSGVRPDLTRSDLISSETEEEDDRMNLCDSVDLDFSAEQLIARRLALIGDDFDRQFRTKSLGRDIPDGVWIPAYACLKGLATHVWNLLTNSTTEPRRSLVASRPCFDLPQVITTASYPQVNYRKLTASSSGIYVDTRKCPVSVMPKSVLI